MQNHYTLAELFPYEQVHFYSILESYGNNQAIWFHLFFRKINENDRKELKKFFWILGKHRGARAEYFRQENRAQAIPSRAVDFVDLTGNLRLYCLRINRKNVVLFNGGYKDARTAQESRISMHFRQANEMATRIDRALARNWIGFTGEGFLTWDEDLLL